MLVKRALQASTALAVFAGVGQAQAGDFYVSVLGGANFLQSHSGRTTSISTDTNYKVDPDVGFLLGGAVGLHLDRWLNGLRAELEASYRRNNLGGHWSQDSFFFGPTGGPIDGRMSTFALMANVWYDINLDSKFKPYLGGGAGWARTKVDGVLAETFGVLGGQSTTFSVERSGFAFQLGAGVNYEIQDGVSIGLGYRFFHGPDIKNDVFIGKNNNRNLPVNFDNENHSVLLSLTIDTN